MVSSAYFSGRKRWERPQAVIFSNNSNGIDNGVPQIDGTEGQDFLILSDHNRSEIDISSDRIENRKRMVNARMRSYHLADKISMSMSWSMLPSRAFSGDQSFSSNGNTLLNLSEYTADGGAGGVDILDWYKNNQGSFYVFLAYDNPTAVGGFNKLNGYSEVYEVFFSAFDYKVIKRGSLTHDFWDISLSLEEV